MADQYREEVERLRDQLAQERAAHALVRKERDQLARIVDECDGIRYQLAKERDHATSRLAAVKNVMIARFNATDPCEKHYVPETSGCEACATDLFMASLIAAVTLGPEVRSTHPAANGGKA